MTAFDPKSSKNSNQMSRLRILPEQRRGIDKRYGAATWHLRVIPKFPAAVLLVQKRNTQDGSIESNAQQFGHRLGSTELTEIGRNRMADHILAFPITKRGIEQRTKIGHGVWRLAQVYDVKSEPLMREREVPRSPGICPGNIIDLAICFEHECSGVSFPHRGLRKCKS